MKAKQLMLLLVGAVVLGSLGWYVRSRDTATLAQSRLRMGDPLLPGLDVNAIALVHVERGPDGLHVEKTGDRWTVRERNGYPANFGTLADLLRKLADLKITQPVEAGPSRHPALEVDLPPEGSGTRIQLRDASGNLLRAVVLGKTTTRDDDRGFGEMPTGRYVRVLAGDGSGDLAKVSDPLTLVQTRPSDWINKDFFRVEQPVSIHVVRPGEDTGFHLERQDEFAEWTLVEGRDGEVLDASKTGIFSSLLGFPSFTDIVMDPDPVALGLGEGTVATISTAKGFTYTLVLGTAQEGDLYPLRVKVTGTFPDQRDAGEGEAEADRERLDKQFQDDLKARREKLEKESALDGWTYLVNKWTVDALLKSRGDLMVSASSPGSDGNPAGFGDPSGSPFGGDIDLESIFRNLGQPLDAEGDEE